MASKIEIRRNALLKGGIQIADGQSYKGFLLSGTARGSAGDSISNAAIGIVIEPSLLEIGIGNQGAARPIKALVKCAVKMRVANSSANTADASAYETAAADTYTEIFLRDKAIDGVTIAFAVRSDGATAGIFEYKIMYL